MGLIVGFIALLMAFLIVYEEYERHQLGAWRLWKESLSGGLAAFLFSIVAGYWLSHFVLGPYGVTG